MVAHAESSQQLSPGKSDRDGKRLQAAQGVVGGPLRLLPGQAHFRELPDDLQDRHLTLEPRQLVSDAEVRAGSKGKVGIGRSSKVQFVRVAKLTRIPIRRSKKKYNLLSWMQPGAANFHLLLGGTPGVLHRTLITQQFLHSRADHFRVLAQFGVYTLLRHPQETAAACKL